jgi:hypothetical protein
MSILSFPRRPRQSFQRQHAKSGGIAGLFWLQPLALQHRRIRELARSLSVEQISTITRLSLRKVVQIIEVRP